MSEPQPPRRGRGRPPRAGERNTKRFSFEVSDAEARAIYTAFAQDPVSASLADFLRSIVLVEVGPDSLYRPNSRPNNSADQRTSPQTGNE